MKKMLIIFLLSSALFTLCGGDTQQSSCLQRAVERLTASSLAALRASIPNLNVCRVTTQLPLSKQFADQTVINGKKIENPLIAHTLEECPICCKSFETRSQHDRQTRELILLPCCQHQVICCECYTQLAKCPYCRAPYFTEKAIPQFLAELNFNIQFRDYYDLMTLCEAIRNTEAR